MSKEEEDAVPIVFIHGFKGAQLINTKTKTIEWITAFQGIGLTKMHYDLPITWQDADTQDRDDIVAGDPITYVAGIVDIYGSLVTWGKKQEKTPTGRPFHIFTWDWRRSLFEALDSLRHFLEDIGRPCQLLGHSMGAILGYAIIQKAYQEGGAALAHKLVHSLLCVGPPFKPMEIFLGSSVPECDASSSRLTPKTAFSLTSTYALIPTYGREETFERVDYWLEHKIGGYLESTGGKLTDQEKIHFGNAINLAKRFQMLVMTPLPEGHPPIAILAGNGVKTNTTIDVEKPDWRHPGLTMGDGTVPYESAMGIPEGVNVIAVETSKRNHVDLCKEIKKIEDLLQKLLDYKNVNETKDEKKEEEEKKSVKEEGDNKEEKESNDNKDEDNKDEDKAEEDNNKNEDKDNNDNNNNN